MLLSDTRGATDKTRVACAPSPRLPAGATSPGALGPWLVVGAAIAWSLWSLRAETLAAAYANDSSVHEQMVRFATHQFQNGHLPLTSWYPYLGLGSPHFLHYQSLPAMLTGLLGLAVGSNAAFRWTLYILVCVWPVSVYCCARLFRLDRWAAAASAALSPFLMSVTGVGYEQKAYIWIGYGVCAQLWGSLTLPVAWGFSWRAIREGSGFLAAAVFVSLTMSLHFETGYLAMMPLLVWPLVAGRPVAVRAGRAAVVGCGALLLSAWVVVPLLAQAKWNASNELLRSTPLVNGYGAPRLLGWLISGRLLDFDRFPVVTLLMAVGFGVACARWRSDARGRVLVIAFVGSLLLASGRTTFGHLVDVIPGSGDIFFRRLAMGAQLAGLLLAGMGAAWCLHAGSRALDRLAMQGSHTRFRRLAGSRAKTALACVASVIVLAPAVRELAWFDRANRTGIQAQRRSDASTGAQLDRLLAYIRGHGGGRVYASSLGVPTFRVGAVPVVEYLASRDVQGVGFTLRTWSLMSNPEYYFDQRNPGDYALFGIAYVILPAGRAPPVHMHLLACGGPFCLWRVGNGGYVRVGQIVGSVSADRTDLGTLSAPLLRSGLTTAGQYLRVSFGVKPPGPWPLARVPRRHPVPAGSVVAETDELTHGEVTATVAMRATGTAVLSASFDPGWAVSVDGHPRPTQMVAPALASVELPAGVHRVQFRYRGFAYYGPLFALSGLSLLALLANDLLRGGRMKPASSDPIA